MVVEKIFRQPNATGTSFDYSYYRTGGGGEVDLVIEGNVGRVAFEIKHASVVGTRDLRGLRDFVMEQDARVGIVITNDLVPRRYDDNLIGLPTAWL